MSYCSFPPKQPNTVVTSSDDTLSPKTPEALKQHGNFQERVVDAREPSSNLFPEHPEISSFFSSDALIANTHFLRSQEDTQKSSPIENNFKSELEHSGEDRIFYSEEKVIIPYYRDLFPDINSIENDISIPAEGRFIAGNETLKMFSQQIFENTCSLIERENRSNNPYEQFRRDIQRANYKLVSPEEEQSLTEESHSSTAVDSTFLEDQAVANLEAFIGDVNMARAIGATFHQTLFTFMPDLRTHPNIVGLPRPGSQKSDGKSAQVNYRIEKKGNSTTEPPYFIITASSSTRAAAFTLKDPKNGEIFTFPLDDIPKDCFLDFHQEALIEISIAVKPNEAFESSHPWSKENFPCTFQCLNYVNIYNSTPIII